MVPAVDAQAAVYSVSLKNDSGGQISIADVGATLELQHELNVGTELIAGAREAGGYV
jgi:hypothetical protein